MIKYSITWFFSYSETWFELILKKCQEKKIKLTHKTKNLTKKV